ncbi:hypothetical protein IAU59_001197 [Kwoniella sp. CBS 9459]
MSQPPHGPPYPTDHGQQRYHPQTQQQQQQQQQPLQQLHPNYYTQPPQQHFPHQHQYQYQQQQQQPVYGSYPHPQQAHASSSSSSSSSTAVPSSNGHQANGSSSRSSSQNQQQQNDEGLFKDPSNLLNVYPFMTYAPTARVAEHISPHTHTYIPSTSSSDLYPQYSQTFTAMDNPTTVEDWAMRQAAEARLREALSRTGQGYTYTSGQGGYQQQAGAYPNTPQYVPTFPPTPTSATYGLQQSQPQSSNLPLPYSFLPSYLPASNAATSSHHHMPPTPGSSTSGTSPSPAVNSSSIQYIETFVSNTLSRRDLPNTQVQAQATSSPAPAAAQTKSRPTPPPRPPSQPAQPVYATASTSQNIPNAEVGRERRTSPRRLSMSVMRSPQPPSSVTSTPTHERMRSSPPPSSPDPLGLTDPSPTKRQKSSRHSSRDISPSLASGNQVSGNADMELASLSMGNDETPKARKIGRKIVEVEIPTRRKTSQGAEISDDEEEDEDDLVWGEDKDGDWRMDDKYRSPPTSSTALPKGSGRTGERDMRSAWQKLENLLEDIFEESDAFPANPSSGDLAGSRFFSSVSKHGATLPLLSVETIVKVSRYITKVKTARKRQASLQGKNDLGEWTAETVSSLLRLLERSMRDAENITVFPDDRKAAAASRDEDGMSKGKKKKSKSGSKKDGRSPGLDGSEDEEDLISEDKLKQHEERLDTVRAGVAAAECCLILFDSEGLSKQMLSEDLLSTSVTVVKDQLEKVIYPIIEGLAGARMSSSYLAHIVASESSTLSKKSKLPQMKAPYFAHPPLSFIAQSACSALPHLTALISKSDLTLSDSLIIQTVYLSISPLFINEPVVKKSRKDNGGKDGLSIMKALKMEALGCLRAAFARYEEQRQWIVEEILSSLVRVPEQNHAQNLFQLANGKSIHTISALLLQLIQASAYGTISRIKKLHSDAAEAEMMGAQSKGDVDEEEWRLCADTIESALRSARIVAGYLVQKSTSTKATKTSHDSDFKAILDLFINDLMTVLYRPEWPAASIYITVFSRIMISSLEDSKVGPEVTAAKGIALDYLGDIAAKLKGLGLEMAGEGKGATLDEIIANADMSGLKNLCQAQQSIQTFLSSAAREDASLSSARDMASIVWAQELQAAIKKSILVVEKLQAEKDEEAQETSQRLQAIGTTLKNTLHNVWMGDVGLFEINDPKQGEVATQASIAASRGRPLQSAVDPILFALLGVMDNPAVGLRSKALRGIGAVLIVDPEVLGSPQIQQALEDRLADPSPAVRDAAVELIGKYIVQRPKLAAEYYPHIAQRTMDAGLGVRKRVIKLLRGIFATMEMKDIRIDICCKMILLTDDQDEGVKTLTDMLYPAVGANTAELLVHILSEFRGSNVVLERAIDGVAKESEYTNHKQRFGQTIDALIGQLIDATEQTEFDSASHVRAIWLLCASNPSQIDTQKASVLLSYLRPPANADDQATNELLLRIFRTCIPHMPKTASTFATDLTKSLMPMISKPAGGFQALKETIGCFCAVTNYLTKDWTRLINVLRACEAKIRPIRKQFLTSGQTSAPSQAGSMMLYITALIAEGCRLDAVALEEDIVDLELRKIASQPLSEYLFEVYLDFSRLPSFQNAATICLGCLFRTYPALLQKSETTTWMQETFSSNNLENQAQLLGVIHEFLASEVQKRAAGVKAKKDVQLLIGNAKELQDSDYSTTIVQNNIEQIFECARSQHPLTQNAALDVLTFVVNQGLYSPVHTVPILVTLETAEDPTIAERALALHSALHTKHASLVTVLFMESAKASYLYQRSITSEPSGHRQGAALLSSWYGLLSDKRAWRHDFLKAISRAFDRDSMNDVNPGFVYYLADNLATLDYKLQEEPMTVVYCLSKVISTCTHLVSLMEEAIISGETDEVIVGKGKMVSVGRDEARSEMEAEKLVDASIVVGLAVLLKNHLLGLYHLPEDKCASHVPGKKSTVGDKPTQRRGSAVLDIGRMQLVRGVHTVGEFRQQQAMFLRLIHEDGTLSDDHS